MNNLGYKYRGNRNKTPKNASLLSKIMLPMIILALLQICIYAGLLVLSGGFSYIKSYSYNLLSEKTGNRKNFIENAFNQKTALVYETAKEVNEITERLLKETNVEASAIREDKELNKRILAECSESLISLIRRNMVNDAFIILDSGTLYDEGETLRRTGLYLRDTDVEENSVSDNKDIFMEIGSSGTARSYGLALDFGWSLYLDVTDKDSGNYDFFFEPINTYAAKSNTPLYNLGYWSGLSRIADSQQGSIKYTLPLVAKDGTVYGVIGIGLLEKTVQQSVPSQDFLSDSTCYVLGLDSEGNGEYQPMIHRGAAYGRLVNSDTVLSARKEEEYHLYDFTVQGNPKSIGSIQKLSLYNSGSPYRHQNWALISVADKGMILSTYYALIRVVLISVLVSFGVSVVAAVVIGRRISMPVAKMVGTLNNSRSNHDLVAFHSSGISEIDTLAASIVDLQVDVTEYASRVSRIITMSGNRIGVFMYDCRSASVFVGESLIKLLNFTALPDGDATISAEEFKERLGLIDKENSILSLPIFGEEESSGQYLNDTREIQYTDGDGKLIWFKFTLTRDKTKVMGLVQDITNTVAEKKRIAQVKDDEYTAKLLEANAALREACAAAERANHTKTDFLSRMSHDIRTPMNAIIGMTAIAENYMDDKVKLADCFNKISVSSRYLLALINEVLDMSKIEAGKFVLAEEKINILELVDNLIEMIKPSVKAKSHELRVHMNQVNHENVIGDSLRIQQVFMNIMSNAVKYTPEGGHIDFSISEKAAGQKKVGCYEFVFTDDGKGMHPEFLEKVFVPFEREEDERVSKEQGTGLGMTITYNIVKMMNGDIQVESELDKGTTFIVTLYLPLDETEPASLKELQGTHVLVVDDEQEVCERTCTMLQDIGMRGEWVLTGQEAMDKIAEAQEQGNDFRAVILDWKMPDMNGVETARAIRKSFGDKILLIISSSYDWTEIEQKAREAGAEAFLSKPLFKQRLITVMKSLLNREQGDALGNMKAEDFSGHRVLLVDDNELNREIAAEIFGMAKLEVETAKDGQEAVDKFEATAPGYYDMIFMDIQMPVMNGYEATRAIRKLLREDAKKIPIVAMTANAFAEDVRNAENAGMNEHVAKPLDIDRLFTVLNKWIVRIKEN
ncbi:MAG: response regulator [Roseburia sp.]|nr:response regulator [Roseburia sp.]